jgi:hypothetical protein
MESPGYAVSREALRELDTTDESMLFGEQEKPGYAFT